MRSPGLEVSWKLVCDTKVGHLPYHSRPLILVTGGHEAASILRSVAGFQLQSMGINIDNTFVSDKIG